jgi:hypothetical protein
MQRRLLVRLRRRARIDDEAPERDRVLARGSERGSH